MALFLVHGLTNGSVVISNLNESTFLTALFYWLKLNYIVMGLIGANNKMCIKVVSLTFEKPTDEMCC